MKIGPIDNSLPPAPVAGERKAGTPSGSNVPTVSTVAISPEATALAEFAPRAYTQLIDGSTIAELGRQPITHMRDFQATGHLGPALLAQIAEHGSG